MATERTLITIIWTLLSTGAFYDEPGPNWYTRQHPERAKRRAIRTVDNLGYNVTITPTRTQRNPHHSGIVEGVGRYFVTISRVRFGFAGFP